MQELLQEALDDAFREQVKLLFQVLNSNLIDRHPCQMDMAAFSKGLSIAVRAYQMARDEIRSIP